MNQLSHRFLRQLQLDTFILKILYQNLCLVQKVLKVYPTDLDNPLKKNYPPDLENPLIKKKREKNTSNAGTMKKTLKKKSNAVDFRKEVSGED